MENLLHSLSLSNLLFYGIISLIPILGWLYFFQKKNHEKRGYVVLSFIAGMLAVLPIKLYEKYWDTTVWYFEHMNVFQYLADLVNVPDISRFLAYITVNALVGMGLFIFVTLIMFVLEIFSFDNTVKIFRTKTKRALESPFFFITIGILCGIVAFALSSSFNSRVWFFVVVGMLEEFVKHLVLRFSDEEKIQSVDDALSFSIIIALGFACVENIVYFHNFAKVSDSGIQQLSLFFLLRSTISVMAHVCFSAILGYFYGVARFAHEIYIEEVQQKKHFLIQKLHQILHLKGEVFFHEEKMMEGMLLAMGAHAIFNSLLEFGKVTLMVPFLLLLFFWILNLFHRKQIHSQTRNLLFST
ncbi:PrsW family intramembrane metalloprotease [Candidatus Gracilibacteria bacterium]|nr:PrsW family intramembrane metalloprotease [Candidatus Gracilibacteria bacterium]